MPAYNDTISFRRGEAGGAEGQSGAGILFRREGFLPSGKRGSEPGGGSGDIAAAGGTAGLPGGRGEIEAAPGAGPSGVGCPGGAGAGEKAGPGAAGLCPGAAASAPGRAPDGTPGPAHGLYG